MRAAVTVPCPKHSAAKFRRRTRRGYTGPRRDGVERTTAIRRRTDEAPPELDSESRRRAAERFEMGEQDVMCWKQEVKAAAKA
jgi:hypothetical protein